MDVWHTWFVGLCYLSCNLFGGWARLVFDVLENGKCHDPTWSISKIQTWGRCSAKNWWYNYQYGSVKASATLISWGLVKPCNQKNQSLVGSFQASWWEAAEHFRGPSWPTSTREVSNLCNHRRPLGFRTRPFPEIVMTLASVWCQSDSIVANRMSRPKGVSSLVPLLQQLRSCYEVRELETARQNIPIHPHVWGRPHFGRRAQGSDILKNPAEAKRHFLVPW